VVTGSSGAERDRYRARADAFEQKVAAVTADQWSNPSPCDDWEARGVVQHVVDMHGAMLRSLGRGLSQGPSVRDDPLGAFRSARADIEQVLDDPELMATGCVTPNGPMTVGQHIDEVASADMVPHGWDLARATGQEAAMDPAEVERMAAEIAALAPELLGKYRTPGAYGPGIVVYGPEVAVPDDAPLHDRVLGLIGRDPYWGRPDRSPAIRPGRA